MENYIVFDNVSFAYTDESDESVQQEQVIENLSLTIEKGDFVCVLGHNGC